MGRARRHPGRHRIRVIVSEREMAPPGIECVVTYLEMLARPTLPPLQPPLGKKLALMRAEPPSLSFYRYLYDAVGRDWRWTLRKRVRDAELRAIIEDPAVEIDVLHVAGVPAGFSELDRRRTPEIELAYFGLAPEFIGQGLGAYFLNWTVRRAWEYTPERLWVHTNTLDHPRALGLYQRMGFVVYDRVSAIADADPDPTPPAG